MRALSSPFPPPSPPPPSPVPPLSMRGEIPRLGATLSSTLEPHVAAHCIDNDEVTTMCHSQEQQWPWVSIQLPPASNIVQIIIFNRYSCCYERLSPFQLWVGQSAGDYGSSTSSACGIHNLTVPATFGPFGFDCTSGTGGAPLVGEYVTLVLPGPTRIINLMGIHAYTYQSPPPLPPPPSPPPLPPPPLPPPPA